MWNLIEVFFGKEKSEEECHCCIDCKFLFHQKGEFKYPTDAYLCRATTISKMDYVTGEKYEYGIVKCWVRNDDGLCKYFKSKAKESTE